MDKSIFQISQEYLDISETLIQSGGEVTPELEQALMLNKEELEVKGAGYGFIIKHIESECDIIDAEIERLSKLKKYRQNAIDRLKQTLSGAMKLHEITEIKTPLLKINFRKSESIEIDDMKLLDRKFINVKHVETADKAAIKDAIKAGEAVLGATLHNNLNLQIK